MYMSYRSIDERIKAKWMSIQKIMQGEMKHPQWKMEIDERVSDSETERKGEEETRRTREREREREGREQIRK